MVYKVIFTGSRDYIDNELVHHILSLLKKEHGNDLLVAQGGAKGLDSLALSNCGKLGIDCVTFHSNWSGRGKYGGIKRNEVMYDIMQPDVVMGFSHNIEGTRGTNHMLGYAEKNGCLVEKYFGFGLK